MKNSKILLLLSLIVVLMTVFGSVAAQDADVPAFMVGSVVPDEKVVLSTRNFPADTSYTVSMADPADPEFYTPVAKFNSKSGGSLSVTIKIPEKFQGLNQINLLLKDTEGARILGSFINVPEEYAASNEEAVEEPAEEPVAEEPAAEEQTEEPVEEPAAEEQTEEPAEEPAAEEQTEETAEETAAEEENTISLVNEQTESTEEETSEEAEEPILEGFAAEEPAAEEQTEETAEEIVEEQTSVEPTIIEPTEIEQPAAAAADTTAQTVETLVCDFSITPTVTINAVTRNETVTFTTNNYPAGKTFVVSMGEYIESWRPEAPKPFVPQLYHPYIPGFDPDPDPNAKEPHGPKMERVVTFKGVEAGSFTSDGSARTLTFQIPAEVKGKGIIALWVQDQGPCGYYSYNYFYNTSTN